FRNIGFSSHLLQNITIHEINQSWIKNINRGGKKLRVWQNAVSLYIALAKCFRIDYGFKRNMVTGLSLCNPGSPCFQRDDKRSIVP
ncbi:MAG: hypothetical protein ACLFUT_11490, partial [Desulfobacteraceae bacterium]